MKFWSFDWRLLCYKFRVLKSRFLTRVEIVTYCEKEKHNLLLRFFGNTVIGIEQLLIKLNYWAKFTFSTFAKKERRLKKFQKYVLSKTDFKKLNKKKKARKRSIEKRFISVKTIMEKIFIFLWRKNYSIKIFNRKRLIGLHQEEGSKKGFENNQ